MKEYYGDKFMDFFTLVYCLDKDVSTEEKGIEKNVITPEEKLDIWLNDKRFKGEAQDLLKIMKSIGPPSKVTENVVHHKERDVLYEMIPDSNKYRYDPFDIFKIMYGMRNDESNK